jgi:hypothetical protein
MSRAHLAVVELALFEGDMFEMAAPIQNPSKCAVHSVIWLLNTKGERPVEIHKRIVAGYGDIMNWQNVTKWWCEFSEGRTDVQD